MENEKYPDDKSNTLPLPDYRVESSPPAEQQPILPTPPTRQPEQVDQQPRSRHQLFLVDLYKQELDSTAIQAEWNSYYNNLTDSEKNQVWHEFNRHQATEQVESLAPVAETSVEKQSPPPEPQQSSQASPRPEPDDKQKNPMSSNFFTSDLPASVQKSVDRQENFRKQYALKEQIKSLLFGLTVGAVFLSVYMFTFFNESYLIPFIQPSTLSASTQVIISPEAEATSSEPRIIIPKLNVEVPVVYDVPFLGPNEAESEFERRVQAALEAGVVHYPSSQRPGEKGRGFNSNTVIVGHSSNNIFNRGEFKFAFMQLRNLEVDDTFVINYQGRQFVYKVYNVQRVAPSEVWVLGPAAEPNSATLITCDPPGFNVNRLVVFAKQISPNPDHNIEVNQGDSDTSEQGTFVPGNAQSLWSRIWNFFF